MIGRSLKICAQRPLLVAQGFTLSIGRRRYPLPLTRHLQGSALTTVPQNKDGVLRQSGRTAHRQEVFYGEG